MLVEFFYELREGGIPVSLTEFLSLLDALHKGVVVLDAEEFYFLARAALVKDERHFDRFDRIFGAYFQGLEALFDEVVGEIPLEWLRKQAQLELSPQDKAAIEALGGWDKLMETLRQRLAEQREAHHGGSKWIGTGGSSPFGAYGYNPEGVRVGQDEGRQGRAVKVWDRREYRNLDDAVELGTRNIKIALRRLRRFAREGAAEELDLDDTIGSTARNAGLLDIRMVPERHNAVKVLLFLDVGGSMNPHVKLCEELFSAARSEFKHLEYFYFHNCVYESVWRDNQRRHAERLPTMQLLNTYGHDHRVVLVGDASMSPYEIMMAGGSVEHWNEEPGLAWMERLLGAYPHAIWLNPVPDTHWDHTASIRMLREIMKERMFPLTLDGLERAIEALKRPVAH
ncbi:MAG: VWA domain-containing protein [Gammaproteobacteria bacterium]|nr:VWA domain-containing protein [Gammaproteobacteria bacterium]